MIEYIVNKEKRTVVAMIKFNKREQTFKDAEYVYDSLEHALRHLKHCKFSDKKYLAGWNKMIFPKYISAKAKCSLDDKWDEEYGKQLARQRLVDKIRKYRSNSYKIIADLIEEMREAISIKKERGIMETLKDIAINESKNAKVFDWDRAAKIIKERKPEMAYAGMAEDWFWTGGTIYANGRPVKSSTYLASTWATPVLRFDDEEIVCYQPKGYHGWNEDTRWPKSALEILNSKE